MKRIVAPIVFVGIALMLFPPASTRGAASRVIDRTFACENKTARLFTSTDCQED